MKKFYLFLLFLFLFSPRSSGLADSLVWEAETAYEQGNYPKVLELLPGESDSSGLSPSYVKLLQLASQAHAQLGNKKQAFYLYEQYTLLDDSLKKQQTAARIARLEQKNQVEENRMAAVQQQAEFEKNTETLYQKTTLLWSLAFVILLSAVLLIYSAKSYSKAKQHNENKKSRLRNLQEIERLKLMLHAELQERKKIFNRLQLDFLPKIRRLSQLISTANGEGNKSPSSAYGDIMGNLNAVKQEMETIFQMHPEPSFISIQELADRIKAFTTRISNKQDIQLKFEYEQEIVPREEAHHLYRIIQEFTQNAFKHAGNQQIVIKLLCTPQGLKLDLINSQKKIKRKSSVIGAGMGLRSIEERVHKIGGTLHLESRPNMRLSIFIPAAEPLIFISKL